MTNKTSDAKYHKINNELEDTSSITDQTSVIESSIESQVKSLSSVEYKHKQTNTEEDNINSDSKKSNFIRKQQNLNYFKKTQHWRGIIIEIDSNEKVFQAHLIDKSDESTYETAEFNFYEVSKSDLKLVKKGSVFYYSIGFSSNNGQIKKEAFIRFKRSIPFDNNDVDNIENRVNNLNRNINWE